KSTLFRALAGEIDVERGVVRMDGIDVTPWPLWKRARAGLGYVPQTPSVLFDLTVAQNLSVFRTFSRQMGHSNDAEALAVELGLGARLGVVAFSLSGGERRRLELVRALSQNPRILLCDEPFSAVDPAGALRVGRAVKALARSGASVLLADHNVGAAL